MTLRIAGLMPAFFLHGVENGETAPQLLQLRCIKALKVNRHFFTRNFVFVIQNQQIRFHKSYDFSGRVIIYTQGYNSKIAELFNIYNKIKVKRYLVFKNTSYCLLSEGLLRVDKGFFKPSFFSS